MQRIVLSLSIALCTALAAQAQTFTDHLRKNTTGAGTVTVSQSEEIDDLVNGANLSPATDGGKQKADVPTHKSDAKPETAPVTKDTKETKTEARTETETATTTTTIDTSKKVMRGAQKVKGYRVQVYAGGNTRADKQRATEAGNAVKRRFPEQPVYVHFYSPRWICRVGNFRTYQEAQRVLKQVQAMGYKSASIVSGKITVQY